MESIKSDVINGYLDRESFQQWREISGFNFDGDLVETPDIEVVVAMIYSYAIIKVYVSTVLSEPYGKSLSQLSIVRLKNDLDITQRAKYAPVAHYNESSPIYVITNEKVKLCRSHDILFTNDVERYTEKREFIISRKNDILATDSNDYSIPVISIKDTKSLTFEDVLLDLGMNIDSRSIIAIRIIIQGRFKISQRHGYHTTTTIEAITTDLIANSQVVVGSGRVFIRRLGVQHKSFSIDRSHNPEDGNHSRGFFHYGRDPSSKLYICINYRVLEVPMVYTDDLERVGGVVFDTESSKGGITITPDLYEDFCVSKNQTLAYELYENKVRKIEFELKDTELRSNETKSKNILLEQQKITIKHEQDLEKMAVEFTLHLHKFYIDYHQSMMNLTIEQARYKAKLEYEVDLQNIKLSGEKEKQLLAVEASRQKFKSDALTDTYKKAGSTGFLDSAIGALGKFLSL